MTPSLRIAGLAFAYPDGHQALFGVNLEIAKGERVALLGPNGAGKTTLVLHLNGLLSGGVGIVEVAGLTVEKQNFPRSVDVSAWSSKILMTSYSCPRSAMMWHSARPIWD